MLGRLGDYYDWKWITTASNRHDIMLPVFLPRFSLEAGGHILRVQANWSPVAEQRHVLQSCVVTEPGSHTCSKKGKICLNTTAHHKMLSDHMRYVVSTVVSVRIIGLTCDASIPD
jgi:hypothetical protein